MKIFLSSTFQDLQEHRKRVMEAIDSLHTKGADMSLLGMEASRAPRVFIKAWIAEQRT